MSGFTDPDPTGATDDDEVEPDFPAEITDEDFDGEFVALDADASCHKCEHFEVCAIFSGIAPMMQDWHTEDEDGGEVPIDLEKLAWHCKKYAPEDDEGFVDQKIE